MGEVKKYKRDTRKGKSNRDYVDKEEFYNELVAYQKQLKAYNEGIEKGEEGLVRPIPSDKIGRYIILIVDRVLSSHRFKGYTDLWKDEMRGEAIASATQSIDKFDPEKSNNPFAYFTTATYYNFYGVIEREKRAHTAACEYNTETHNDYDPVGADGFIYNVREDVHDSIANNDIDWGYKEKYDD